MFSLQYSEYGASDVLSVTTAEEPHATAGEVRIAVRATGVTPADWYLRSGRLVEVMPLTLPHTPGVDAAGVVDEVGEGVSDVSIGDAVFGLTPSAHAGGAAAEFAVLEAWAPKPEAWTWEEAGGAAGNIETATRVLDLLDVSGGEVLLIEGAAGGVGSATIQLAVARGVTVIGTASERNHDFLRSLGARPTTYGPGLADRVQKLSPQGVHAVLDAAGSGSLGELVAIAGGPSRVVSIADFSAHEHGVVFSRTGGPGGDVQGLGGLAVAADLAGKGRFTVPVHATFPLERAHEAHDESTSGRARGKIIITVP